MRSERQHTPTNTSTLAHSLTFYVSGFVVLFSLSVAHDLILLRAYRVLSADGIKYVKTKERMWKTREEKEKEEKENEGMDEGAGEGKENRQEGLDGMRPYLPYQCL